MESGTLLSRYTVISRIGAGGMGEVYRARDEQLEREVALKVLPSRLAQDTVAMERFRREAVLLASVNHPHIATLHGLEEAEGVQFLVMELVEGKTLERLLASGGLSVVEALRVASQISKALEAAHKRGIIHRDLKPANVMVGPNRWVKVLDFGVAKAFSTQPGEPQTTSKGQAVGKLSEQSLELAGDLTAVGTVVGTPAYISPEQLRDQPSDNRVDIWAFGCLLFELLAGHKAFHGKTTRETFDEVLRGSPDWDSLPSTTPQTVRTLLGRCLQKDPDLRLHSISDARIELDEVLHPMLAPQQPPTQVAATPEPAPTSSTLGYLARMGEYSVVERLGAGGSAEVYRAWDRREGRDVALKVLRPGLLNDPEAVEHLRHEGEVLRQLDHPNLAGWLDFGSADELDYLVMEYVPGDSLAVKLEEGPLPEPEVVRLGSQIAAGLAEAHEHDLLHGDIKAGNVLVTPEGQAKVIDFGLARFLKPESPRQDGNATAAYPLSQQAAGPLAYTAPEVLAGEPPSTRSDLYSLGVLLYQMATGQRPFEEESEQELTEAILRQPPRDPSALRPTLSSELDAVIQRCLSKEPDERFASAREIAEILEEQIPEPSPTSMTALLQREAVAAKTRQRRKIGIAAALLLVAVATAVFFMMRGGQEAAAPSRAASVDSLVVMPARILSESTAAYLTDAVPNSLSTYLSQVSGLETKLPPSSLDVERVGGGLEKIASAYGVEAMVLSTVNALADGLVLNVQLVDASDRGLLWSQEYRGQLDTYPELIQSAAEGIRLAVRPESTSLGAADGSQAEISMQQGLYYSNLYRNRFRPGDKERAIEAFKRALEMDPDRAQAAAEIAVLHAASLASGVSILEVMPELRSWTDQALAIDPKSSLAWAVLGEVEGGRTPESYHTKLEYALRSATYGPRNGYAHSRLAGPLAAYSPSLALAAAEEATRVEPLVMTSPLFESLLLTTLNRWDEALERTEYALNIEPGTPFGLVTKALVLSQLDEQEALSLAEVELDALADQGLLPPLWIELARDTAEFGLANAKGETERAEAAAQRLLALARGEKPFPRWQLSTKGVAVQLARYGRTEDAIELLQFRAREALLPSYETLLLNSDLDEARQDPRFQALLAEARAKFDQTTAILEEARARGEMPPYLEEPLANLMGRLREGRNAA